MSGAVLAAGASAAADRGEDTTKAFRDAQRRNEGRAAKAEARKAVTAARRAVIASRTGPTGFSVGQWVRTRVPRSPRFHNRLGVVASNNLGEVGVGFGGPDWVIKLPDVEAWFLPGELVLA